MNLIVRIFPKQKRASFVSQHISIEGNQITVEKLLQHLQLSNSEYKCCRGVEFLSLSSLLVHNETLNLVPI